MNITRQRLLKFGRGNAKLSKEIYTFSLPAGWTCPGALQCLARADRESGELTEGNEQKFRCFSATAESIYPNVRAARWHNFECLKGLSQQGMVELIEASLPPQAKIVRIHVSGDFFSNSYFAAWCQVAIDNPPVTFYAYTKSIHFWKKNEKDIPANFVLTASEGGRFDSQINGLKRAKVVFSEEEASALGLEIDHDDKHAYLGQESFALLLRSTQAKGTPAAKALSALRARGLSWGYKR